MDKDTRRKTQENYNCNTKSNKYVVRCLGHDRIGFDVQHSNGSVVQE
jgi:hypothetical protein